MTAAGSLGHVLLSPQRLPRTAGTGEAALLDDLLAAIARVTADGAQGGTIAEDLEAAVEALVQRLLTRAGSGLHRAIDRLQDLMRPLAGLAERLPAMLEDDEPAVVADTLLDLLGSLADVTGGLSIERLRDQMTLLVDVLQEDLGLTSAALEEEFWALVDDVVERVETIPDGLDAGLRANRIVVGDTLRRIRRRVHGSISFPELRADVLATLLFEVLEPLIGEQLKQVACVGHVAGDTLAAIEAIRGAVPFTGFGSGSIGAAEAPPAEPDREYLWYPSWVLGDKDIKWYELWRLPGDVWVDRTGTQVQVRFRGDRLYLTDAFTWTDIPIGDDPFTVSFKHPGPEVMEKIAWHSGWAADATTTLFHIVSPLSGLTIKKGGQVSVVDLLDLGVGLGNTGLKAFKKMPFSFFAVPGSSWGTVVGWTPTIGAHLLGSLQGLHTSASGGNAFKFWALIIIPGDAIRNISAGSLPSMVREGLLSFLTLYNYDGPSQAGDDAPINYKQMDGMLAVFQFVGTILMVKLCVDRRYYGHPFTGNSTQVTDFTETMWLRNFLLCGTVFGVINGFLGTLMVWALMAATGSPATNTIVLFKNIGVAVLRSLALFWINVYAFRENDTDDGRFNPGPGGPFAGYADADTSPYLLPWKGGETYMCGQGNMGIFSHNNTNPGGSQVYAYDFMLDKGDEICASRAGTVVDYFDWCPDDQNVSTNAPTGATVTGQTGSDNWNFIAIRHDTADPHDVGPGGTAVTTYAVYGHGLNSGVRDVFAARTPPVAAANIIGTVVAQGEPIMFADSTGVSFCNHLHMQVEVGPATSGPAAVGLGQLGPTIPFVFKDGGQPGSRTWHESENAS